MDEDSEAHFRAFVEARSSALLGTAYLLTGDQHRAEDLLQSALVKAYRHWGRIRAGGNGLAVFPTGAVGREKVTVSRDGRTVAARQLNSDGGGPIDVRALVPDAEVARAVRDGGGTPDGTLAGTIARMAAADLAAATVDEPTGVRVPWGGPVTAGRRAVLVALTLPSGALYVDSAGTEGPDKYARYSGDYHGLLPAGGLDGAVLGFQNTDGLVVVVAPDAARAEVVLAGGGVLPVRLTGGGGGVVAPAGQATVIRAYRADGSLLGSRVPGTGLLPLPRTF
ncbi:MAG TPA: sigma factor [Mycobacteriales bacterium]